MKHEVIHGDNLLQLKMLDTQCVDLVFTSPPYEAARTYGINFKLRGQDWVDWCVPRYLECLRVCKGLVAWVVEGQTRQFRYSAAPILLMADLHRAGVKLRKPPVFNRVGIPGSGGPDWLRNDYEFIVCAAHGKLPWSDNTAMGHPPKWAPGGEMSSRLSNGTRCNQWGPVGSENGGGKRFGSKSPRPSHQEAKVKNQWGHSIDSGATVTDPGGVVRCKGRRPSHRLGTGQNLKGGCHSPMPVLANPGNVIKCIVGGGVMGSKLAHENEAPFPESLAEFFVRSFCPPGGTVLDPHGGSGTVAAVCEKLGRNSISIDVRESQILLMQRRIAEVSA